MDIYDVFTRPEEGNTLLRCGVGINTASFASIRNAPSNYYSNPVVVPSISKPIIDRAASTDSSMIIPVWCMNDLIQVAYDNNIPIRPEVYMHETKRERISAFVSLISENMTKEAIV